MEKGFERISEKKKNISFQDFLLFLRFSTVSQGQNGLFLATSNLLPGIAFNPLPDDKFYTGPNWNSLQTTILDLVKILESFSKWVENTVGEGEIARYEQFLLFPQCFQKARFPGASEGVIVWE